MTEIDATLPRETGQEKAGTTCPSCGAPLGVIESPYGSTSAETCKKCFPPADTRQQASAPSLQRQQGTPVVPSPSSVPGLGASDAQPGEGV